MVCDKISGCNKNDRVTLHISANKNVSSACSRRVSPWGDAVSAEGCEQVAARGTSHMSALDAGNARDLLSRNVRTPASQKFPLNNLVNMCGNARYMECVFV